MKHTFYASSHAIKSFLPCTFTLLYFQEQGRTFFHTMNYLVVKQYHQNVQILSQNLMLQQILATGGVNFPLKIPDVPDIPFLTNVSSTSTYDMPNPPTYEHLHRNLLPERM